MRVVGNNCFDEHKSLIDNKLSVINLLSQIKILINLNRKP
mgnify:CR=1 FL=1